MRGERLNEIVAGNVRALRREAGLSQERLAEICGVHRTFIGGIERVQYNITLGTLEVLAKGLDVEPASLLVPQPSRASRSTKRRRLRQR